MENQQFTEAQMRIRRPARDVFDAFIDPGLTKNFWFTKGSGKLEVGKTVTWEWEMYGVSTQVTATEIVPGEKISIQWDEPATTVDFNFKSLPDGSTYVIIRQYGFHQTGDDLVATVRDTTGGFTTVLDGLKCWMEHGFNLNLIADKFPKEITGN